MRQGSGLRRGEVRAGRRMAGYSFAAARRLPLPVQGEKHGLARWRQCCCHFTRSLGTGEKVIRDEYAGEGKNEPRCRRLYKRENRIQGGRRRDKTTCKRAQSSPEQDCAASGVRRQVRTHSPRRISSHHVLTRLSSPLASSTSSSVFRSGPVPLPFSSAARTASLRLAWLPAGGPSDTRRAAGGGGVTDTRRDGPAVAPTDGARNASREETLRPEAGALNPAPNDAAAVAAAASREAAPPPPGEAGTVGGRPLVAPAACASDRRFTPRTWTDRASRRAAVATAVTPDHSIGRTHAPENIPPPRMNSE